MGCDQIVALLLENGADVNSKNYCGQVLDLMIIIFFIWVMFFLRFLYCQALILENHGLI